MLNQGTYSIYVFEQFHGIDILRDAFGHLLGGFHGQHDGLRQYGTLHDGSRAVVLGRLPVPLSLFAPVEFRFLCRQSLKLSVCVCLL